MNTTQTKSIYGNYDPRDNVGEPVIEELDPVALNLINAKLFIKIKYDNVQPAKTVEELIAKPAAPVEIVEVSKPVGTQRAKSCAPARDFFAWTPVASIANVAQPAASSDIARKVVADAEKIAAMWDAAQDKAKKAVEEVNADLSDLLRDTQRRLQTIQPVVQNGVAYRLVGAGGGQTEDNFQQCLNRMRANLLTLEMQQRAIPTGPTLAELDAHPALKAAWDNYNNIRNSLGL